MSRRTRESAALVLPLVVVVAVLGLVLRPRESEDPSGGSRAPTTPPEPAAPHLRGPPAPEPSPDARAASEAAPAGDEAAVEEEAPPPCSLFGTVRRGPEPLATTVRVQRSVDLSGPESPSVDRLFESALWAPDGAARVVATVSTGEDGRYEVLGLSPGIYQLTVRTADGGVGLAQARLLDRGDRRRADLTLPDGPASLLGRVAYADGRPWRGLVDVRNEDAEGEPSDTVCFVATGGDGRFVARGLRPGPASVRVVEEPSLSVTRERAVTLPHDGELVVVVDERLVRRRCTVVAAQDRTPIADAFWVTWTHDGADHCFATGRASAAGQFVMPTLPSGGDESHSVFVRVSAQGYLPAHRWDPLPEDPVTFELVKAARLEGQVRDAATRRPVPGARVLVVGAEAHESNGAVSDAQGRYAVGELAEGEVLVLVAGGGWISADPLRGLRDAVTRATARVVAGQTMRRDIEVFRSPRLQGRVLDPSGLPVAEATVRAEVAERQTPELCSAMLEVVDAARRATGETDPPGPTDPGAFRRALADSLELLATSDGEGWYRLDGLLPGVTYRIGASADGNGDSEPVEVVLRSGQRESADLRLSGRD